MKTTQKLSTLSLDIVRTRLAAIDMEVKKTRLDEYRVNFKGGREATAYYATDLDDALATGRDMAKRRDAGTTTQQRAALVAAVNRARVDMLDATDAVKECVHAVDAALCIAIGVVVRKNAEAAARLQLVRTLSSITYDADTSVETLTMLRDAVRAARQAARKVGDHAVGEALTRVEATFDDFIAMQGNYNEATRVELAARNAAQSAGVR